MQTRNDMRKKSRNTDKRNQNKLKRSDDVRREKNQVINQFKNIKKHQTQSKRLSSSYGKSIYYIAESPAIKHFLKQVKNGVKKKFFNGLSKTVNILVDKLYKFKEGDERIE